MYYIVALTLKFYRTILVWYFRGIIIFVAVALLCQGSW